ncbi:MAG TPA: acyl-ACP--UDP-N-acetylglucosamine O-acyltransferase [Burkholderiaceae bacterium]|nr:acyl-ACP--UDP-N-acetylglucosamine O-acyltransferase [Burkholderiaceae bacterium]
MPSIHPTALVEGGAELADDVEVGPYSVVGPAVRIGAGTVLMSHVVVGGRTSIGRGNRFFPFSAIGGVPQDKKYGGEDTELVIGDGNTVREHCTMSLGTVQGGGVTRVGSDNWIMANVHIAHDCLVGDHTILANNVTLAGHVTLGDWVFLGGMSAIHQFCVIGPHAMAAGGAIVLRDVPPFVTCSGNPAEPHGIHSEGLKRRAFESEVINGLRRAYRIVYKDGLTTAEAVQKLDELALAAGDEGKAITLLRDFVRDSQRGIIR